MKIPATFLAILLFLLPLLGHAALPDSVVQALKSGGIPEEAVSVYARRVDADVPVLAERDEVPRNPASVMKLLTTYAGL